MTFSQYLSGYLGKLASDHRLLVVRDPAGRYRPICFGLAEAGVVVVDGDRPSIEVREDLVPLWTRIPTDPALRVVLYRSDAAANPLHDPLAAFERVGRLFPAPGAAHEDYRSLVRSAYPDRGDEVDALFSGGEPSIAAVDSLAGGNRYPALTGLTGHSGPLELVLALLTGEHTLERATATAGAETAALLGATVGLSELPDRAGLWRYLLASEFVLDLPAGPPAELTGVPVAPAATAQTVFALCRRLRLEHEALYVEEAERVERELNLAPLALRIPELGQVDTFAFESAAALRLSVSRLVAGDAVGAAELRAASEQSVWARHDYRLQSTWQLVRQAVATLEALGRAVPAESESDPVGWYRRTGSAVDRNYRSYVLTLSRLEDEAPYGAPLPDLSESLGARYREWLAAVQEIFVRRVRSDGWPLPGLLRQDRVFAHSVASLLAEEKRVAYFLVDALRYELGDALGAKLEPDHTVGRAVAAALLPTKTALGMSALAPDTSGPLAVVLGDDGWSVRRGESRLATASDRDALYRAHLGDQVLVETLERWLERGPRQKPDARVRLAVIRSTEIDSAGEAADPVFRSSVEGLVSSVVKAIRKCFAVGFDAVVVSADHGFLYLPDRRPGDQVTAPAGETLVKGDRYAFGRFAEHEALILLPAERLGYRLEGPEGVGAAFPASFGSFVKPGAYVHGGLSLQEALVPVLTVTPATRRKEPAVMVTLSYRGHKRARATSLTPSVTIAVTTSAPALGFDEESVAGVVEIGFRIGAGEPGAGEIGPNEYLDPDTGTLRIRPGTTTTIPLRLDEETRGECAVSAFDPATGKQYDVVTLDVDILE